MLHVNVSKLSLHFPGQPVSWVSYWSCGYLGGGLSHHLAWRLRDTAGAEYCFWLQGYRALKKGNSITCFHCTISLPALPFIFEDHIPIQFV